jgi:hypothetical protein
MLEAHGLWRGAGPPPIVLLKTLTPPLCRGQDDSRTGTADAVVCSGQLGHPLFIAEAAAVQMNGGER